MVKRLSIILSVAAMLAISATAAADEGGVDTQHITPIQYSLRPLTTPGNTLNIHAGPVSSQDLSLTGAFGIGILHNRGFSLTSGLTNAVTFGFGASYGITDDFEVGLGFPLMLSPDADLGDLPLWASYRFIQGKTQVGARLNILIPASSDFQLEPGIQLSSRPCDAFRIEAGLFFRLIFADTFYSAINVPVRLTYSVTRNIYLGLQTGLHIALLPDPFDPVISIPLLLHYGYTIDAGGTPIDISAQFGWRQLFAVSGGNSDTFTELWDLYLGANVAIAF